MKIAQISPLYESVPPKCYGGTERVVAYLTDALLDLGHEVTLFASADSITRAKLIPTCEHALRLDSRCVDPLAWHVLQLQQLIELANQFDIIHFHTHCLHFPYYNFCPTAQLTTLHGRLDIREIVKLHQQFPTLPLVSISNHQRQPLTGVNWVDTVYHGLPETLYQPNFSPDDYLLFLGRTSPEKRLDRAIEIARRCGKTLKVGAKIDDSDRDYYNRHLQPLMTQPHVDYVGEVSEKEKQQLIGQAAALLFPIDWPEPFGMVMIEAMACATPVIAWANGSVPEVITSDISGKIVSSMDEAVSAVDQLAEIDRHAVHEEFIRRFTANTMANHYVKLYQQLIQEKSRELS